MNFLHEMAAWQLRPRILHELPGRLRLELPILGPVQNLPHAVQDRLETILGLPPGVTEVELSPVTKTAVFQFDDGMLTANDISAFAGELTHLAIRLESVLRDLEGDALEAVLGRLENLVAEKIQPRLTFSAKEVNFNDLLAE